MNSLYCNLIITRTCNLKCSSCGAWKHGGKFLDFSKWTTIIDRAFDYNRPAMVGVTGGEPLLHPDVNKIIDYVHSKGIFVGINSNGTQPLSKYKSLLATHVNSIGISLHFISAAEQDEFCGCVGAYKQIIDTLRYLKANKGNKFVYVQCTLTGLNYSQFKTLKTFINQDIGLPIMATPATWGDESSILKTSNKSISNVGSDFAEFKKYIQGNFGTRILRTPTFIKLALKTFETGLKQWQCNAGHKYYSISPSGNFCICQDFETPVSFLDDKYTELLSDKDFITKWDDVAKKCSGCTYPCYLETQMSQSRPWELVPKGLAYLYWKLK